MTDIIFLSNAKTEAHRNMTQMAVDSCWLGTELPVNIIVLEQSNSWPPYENCYTKKMPSIFNFNEFANVGARMGSAENIVIANNDLVFENGWLEELIKADWPICSSKCPDEKRQKTILENEVGELNGKHFSGWCFLIKRSLFDKIGGFDEDFHYLCADDSLIEQVKKEGIKPMLVPSSIVRHIGGQTKSSKIIDADGKAQIQRFNKKYGKNLFNLGVPKIN